MSKREIALTSVAFVAVAVCIWRGRIIQHFLEFSYADQVWVVGIWGLLILSFTGAGFLISHWEGNNV